MASFETLVKVRAALDSLPQAADPGYGRVWVNTATGALQYSLADGDEQDKYDAWTAAFEKIDGITSVEGEAEIGAPNGPGWQEVRRTRT